MKKGEEVRKRGKEGKQKRGTRKMERTNRGSLEEE